MFHILRRYVNLHIDDAEMKNTFENHLITEETPTSSDFILMKPYYFNDEFLYSPEITNLPKLLTPLRQQRFSLPSPLINYLLTATTNPRIQQKLLKTCKYFVKNIKTRICWHLRIDEFLKVSEYHQESLRIMETDLENFDFTNLHIINCLVFNCSNSEGLRALIPKIYKCDVRFIQIKYQRLSWREFTILLSNPAKVEKINFFENNIYKEDESLVEPDVIISMFPRATYIEYVMV